jgi:hypothetical protein
MGDEPDRWIVRRLPWEAVVDMRGETVVVG